ncbi:MAG TPA: bifunctional rhamnulose-1-phosphate aldolase/short-chain dehydrogenase [Acidobacteriaceae bacterium]|jgi:rhamnose utilization protein RhaD (predicted bifunctional aldolase and dehydrogenase)/NAD(P)-dependent dehydrogenase (short-subunit alcohol dehydrogenase family)|nr:bifunctional rhamnulose-1-phosphate aldolase/short-chain dehydrogenase [Acidobacteriaceae bacterium]
MKTLADLRYLSDLWDEKIAAGLDEPELLRYRSNLLGADLRITNFGGGNTSSKIIQSDPLTGEPTQVLWVKGSGGDLGSIRRKGFATLYLEKLHALEVQYGGVDKEDLMVEKYPLCTFDQNSVVASIDTPLHGFLPFRHVDHLHPDWAIALAASANGKEKMEEFNRKFGHRLVWLPWQRPGFELGLMLRRAVKEEPGVNGVVLGGHGLFTWGDTQRECYRNTLKIIDDLGQFVQEHVEHKRSAIFGGEMCKARADRRDIALELMPFLRGQVSQHKRMIGSWTDLPEVMEFVNAHDAAAFAHLGTSCPDHFIRTKIRPMFVAAKAKDEVAVLKKKIESALALYRTEYEDYYRRHAEPSSPAMRDATPAVVLIPGIGMFSFGKNKAESRITGEFYINAIHVMEGATGLAGTSAVTEVPQAGAAASSASFTVHANYVSLPASEAFRIEYWALEEAKIQRQPREKELSRRIVLIVGGASGIGRATVCLATQRGAHVMIADRDLPGATTVAKEAQELVGLARNETIGTAEIDIRDRNAIGSAIQATVAQFGGLDILINTAAVFPASPTGVIDDRMWATTLDLNVTANYLLADEASKLFALQNLDGVIVLTSSANAVVPKRGSEAYDVSKAALSHLVRELAVSLAPRVRVNGISPATVVKGSTMFPRDRVIASLNKYGIAFDSAASDEQLRDLLAEFYAQRTLTHRSIDPEDCAQAILFLAGPYARCTSGHLIPVDGGLPEAFLR